MRLHLINQSTSVSSFQFIFLSDMRLPSAKASASLRSINLAISARGIAALQSIDKDAASHFLENVIPMKGRMIHDRKGRQQSQPYDRDGQVRTNSSETRDDSSSDAEKKLIAVYGASIVH